MSLDTQIRRAYQEGASIDEIAKQFDCHPTAVKSALTEAEEFTDEDARAMAGVIKGIALNGDNERNRLTAAMYVYDVKKGFRTSKQDTPTVTAVQINQLINAANFDIQKLCGPAPGNRESQSIVVQAEPGGAEQIKGPAGAGGETSQRETGSGSPAGGASSGGAAGGADREHTTQNPATFVQIQLI